MTYTVEANNLSGPVRPSVHETVDEALVRAVELMSKGARDVYIINPDGGRFTPEELARDDGAPARDDSRDN